MRRGVMLVEADAIEAEAIHFLPDLKMFLIGAGSNFGVVMLAGQGIGMKRSALNSSKVCAVGQQIENEDFHFRTIPSK